MSLSAEATARLQEIYDRDGTLTPDAVVLDAKDPDSPLHEHFDFDVERAAMSHWRSVARGLISSVRVHIRTETYTLSSVGYVRDPDKDSKEQGYVAVASVRSDKDRARRVLEAELSRAESAMARAYDVAHALGLQNEVEAIRAQINGIRSAA